MRQRRKFSGQKLKKAEPTERSAACGKNFGEFTKAVRSCALHSGHFCARTLPAYSSAFFIFAQKFCYENPPSLSTGDRRRKILRTGRHRQGKQSVKLSRVKPL
jgi:hypothetical protein